MKNAAAIDVWQYRRGTAGARLMAEFALERGIPLTSLIAGTGLAEADLYDPRAEIVAAQELALIKNYLVLDRDGSRQGFALGRKFHFTAFGLWGLGLMSCATVADALAMAMRFLPMTYAFSDIHFEVRGRVAMLIFADSQLPDALNSFLVERDMGAAVLLLEEFGASHLRIDEVSRTAPPHKETKEQRLAGKIVTWAAPQNSVAFDVSFLSMSLPKADANSASMCEQMCEMLLERRFIKNEIGQSIRSILENAAGEWPDLPSIARRFEMSERSLKRKLAAEGTSFSALRDESRRTQALSLLKEERLPLHDVAERLGFSDLSSFSQTFKRWFGVSPGSFRRKPPRQGSSILTPEHLDPNI